MLLQTISHNFSKAEIYSPPAAEFVIRAVCWLPRTHSRYVSIGCVINFKKLVSVSINYGSLMQLTGVETKQLRHP
jgi:hypothetical protein